jgi:hypothetical protein
MNQLTYPQNLWISLWKKGGKPRGTPKNTGFALNRIKSRQSLLGYIIQQDKRIFSINNESKHIPQVDS